MADMFPDLLDLLLMLVSKRPLMAVLMAVCLWILWWGLLGSGVGTLVTGLIICVLLIPVFIHFLHS